MKFQKLAPFEKHIKESYPDHLLSVYLVVSPKEGERKKILSSLASILKRDSDFKKTINVRDALEHMRSGSLFSGKMGALFDGVSELVKGEMEPLLDYVASPSSGGVLVLGSAKNVPALYKAGKKEMGVLDLTAEKPWEEKERLRSWAIQLISARKKRIASDAVEALFAQIPADRLLIGQEVEKLLTYIGERGEITRTDVEALCAFSADINPFQLAQELAFGAPTELPDISDVSVLIPLVAQLRNQLEMGLKMAVMLDKGRGPEEIGAAFPRLWPKALRTCLDGAKQKGAPFFKEALRQHFDLELGLKSSLGRPNALFHRFCERLLLFAFGSRPKV